MKAKNNKVLFKKSLFGYNKNDVNRFILHLDHDAQQKLIDSSKEIDKERKLWEEERAELKESLAKLERETETYKTMCDTLSAENDILKTALQSSQPESSDSREQSIQAVDESALAESSKADENGLSSPAAHSVTAQAPVPPTHHSSERSKTQRGSMRTFIWKIGRKNK